MGLGRGWGGGRREPQAPCWAHCMRGMRKGARLCQGLPWGFPVPWRAPAVTGAPEAPRVPQPQGWVFLQALVLARVWKDWHLDVGLRGGDVSDLRTGSMGAWSPGEEALGCRASALRATQVIPHRMELLGLGVA